MNLNNINNPWNSSRNYAGINTSGNNLWLNIINNRYNNRNNNNSNNDQIIETTSSNNNNDCDNNNSNNSNQSIEFTTINTNNIRDKKNDDLEDSKNLKATPENSEEPLNNLLDLKTSSFFQFYNENNKNIGENPSIEETAEICRQWELLSFEEKDKFLNYNKSNPEKKESNEKEIKEKEIKEITVDFLLPSNFFDPKNEEENSEDKSQEEEEEEAEEYEFNNDFTVDFNNGINDPSIQTVNSLIYQSIRRQNPFVEANKISDTVKNMQPNLMAWKRMFAASYQMGNMYGQNYMMGNADQT